MNAMENVTTLLQLHFSVNDTVNLLVTINHFSKVRFIVVLVVVVYRTILNQRTIMSTLDIKISLHWENYRSSQSFTTEFYLWRTYFLLDWRIGNAKEKEEYVSRYVLHYHIVWFFYHINVFNTDHHLNFLQVYSRDKYEYVYRHLIKSNGRDNQI